MSIRSPIAPAAALASAAAVAATVLAAPPSAPDEPGQSAPATTHTLALPQFATSPAGRELLGYVVSCALPAGIRLESDGHRFAGSLGLAPGWLHGALGEREQRLVSACLLARTNFFGRPVRISMRSNRADAPAGLRADEDERAHFARLEASFFGNLFDAPATAYVCAGDARDDRTEWLQRASRICSIPVGESGDARAAVGAPTACGFTYVGSCSARPFVQAGIDYSDAVIEVHLPEGRTGRDEAAVTSLPVAPRSDSDARPWSMATQTWRASGEPM